MASIERRGDGWRVRWRGIDGRPRGRQCPSKRTAQDLAREVEDCIARGRDWTAVAPVAVELHDVAQAYLDDLRRRAKVTTREAYRSILTVWLEWAEATYPRRPTDALSRDGLAAYHAHLLDPDRGRRGPLAPRSAIVWVGLIGRMWTWAAQSDRFGGVVGAPRLPQMPRRPTAPRREAPSWSDVDRLLDQVAHLEWLRRLVWVLRCTGLRVSQGLSLEWADVDLEARTLRVRRGKSGQESAGRTVPLAPVLVAEMAGWGRREGRLCGDVGLDARGNVGAGAHHGVARAWSRVQLAPGIAEAVDAQPFHCLRRAFVSELRAAGVDEEVRAALVGHAGGLTSDTYTTASALWPAMVEAVALVPGWTPAGVSFEARRVRSVSTRTP